MVDDRVGPAPPPKSGGSQKYIREGGDPCDLGSEAKNRGSGPTPKWVPPPPKPNPGYALDHSPSTSVLLLPVPLLLLQPDEVLQDLQVRRTRQNLLYLIKIYTSLSFPCMFEFLNLLPDNTRVQARR